MPDLLDVRENQRTTLDEFKTLNKYQENLKEFIEQAENAEAPEYTTKQLRDLKYELIKITKVIEQVYEGNTRYYIIQKESNGNKKTKHSKQTTNKRKSTNNN